MIIFLSGISILRKLEVGLYLAEKNAVSSENSHPNVEFAEGVAPLFGTFIIDTYLNQESNNSGFPISPLRDDFKIYNRAAHISFIAKAGQQNQNQILAGSRA